MEYTGTVSDCDICALSKSKQQAHPKKSTRATTRPMHLIYTDLMGPFTPPAKGGYRYVSKFTDDYSRMKEVYLLRNKPEAAESLHQYNMTVAVPLGLRIEIVRCDKGGEYIGKEFKTLCVNAGINVEYTATSTPQQNGLSERNEPTLAQITRCLMKDGNFPPSLWGELIFTVAYLPNRSPHSALGVATPYFRMHNKEADLSGLRAIGARAFVHRETYTRKLDDRAFERKLCGFGQDSRAYRIYNPAKGTVVESRNVTFWRRRHTACPWASRQNTTTTRKTSSDSRQHCTDLSWRIIPSTEKTSAQSWSKRQGCNACDRRYGDSAG